MYQTKATLKDVQTILVSFCLSWLISNLNQSENRLADKLSFKCFHFLIEHWRKVWLCTRRLWPEGDVQTVGEHCDVWTTFLLISLFGMAYWLFAPCFQCAEIQHPRCQDRGVTRVPLQRLSVVRVWTYQVWHPLLLWAGGGRKVQSPSWGTVHRCQEICLCSQHSLLDFWHKVQWQCIFYGVELLLELSYYWCSCSLWGWQTWDAV